MTRTSTSTIGTARFFAKREANGKKVFWSRGNGWVLAGLARMLQFLPPDHPSRARFEKQYHDMADKFSRFNSPMVSGA